ncbi:MAG: hypothetical protein PSV36_06330 [Algoriphagus sp.]|nr:hypothetical protein [Algoriphagus sp.]
MLDFILPLLGRLHPLLVHLPIGILIFGILLIFMQKKNSTGFNPVIRLAFLLGAISATLAGISGFFQYQFEGFAWESVQNHLIAGVISSIGSFYLFTRIKDETIFTSNIKLQVLALFLVLTVTGHLGGNISRGEEYLIEVLPAEIQAIAGYEAAPEKSLEIPEQGWEELVFYGEVVQPILNKNCKSCHNPRNLKGEFNLTTFEELLKGGENGEVLKAGNPELSALFAKMILPLEDEDHMPPKEKRQPSKEEIELIKSWIAAGASQNTTLGQAGVDEKLLEPFFHKEEIPFYPLTEVAAVPADTLSKLRSAGFFSETVLQGSSWLKVSCINFPGFTDSDWILLKSVKDQIAYLDLSATQVTEEILDSISSLPNLTVLKLNQTGISGRNLEALSNCKNLKMLYLNSTQLSLENLSGINQHPNLQKVFAFQTPAGESKNPVKFSFELETGNYSLPKIPADTIVY